MADQLRDGFLRDSSSGALVVLGANGAQAGAQGELGYAEITGNVTCTSVEASKDVPGLSVTVTVGSRPIVLEVEASSVFADNASSISTVGLQEGATVLASTTRSASPANELIPVKRSRRLTPTPGAHTYKVTLGTLVAGTTTLSAAANSPAFIRVIEV